MSSSTPLPPAARELLDFWFGAPAADGSWPWRAEWFRKDPAFDAQIRARFAALVDSALAGGLNEWETAAVDDRDDTRQDGEGAAPPLAALALLILLDQLPRNLFRDQARAYAGDARALQLASRLVSSGLDRRLAAVQRVFVYLPFEHAETLAAQRCAMALFGQLAKEAPALADVADWARRHQVVIERFGRFPHRNAALGRESSAEELSFLAEPGSRF